MNNCQDILKCCKHLGHISLECDRCKMEHLQNQVNSLCKKVTELEALTDASCKYVNNHSALIENAQDGIEKCFERIERLEQSREAHSRTNKDFSEKLKELEQWKDKFIEGNIIDSQRIRELEQAIRAIKELFGIKIKYSV